MPFLNTVISGAKTNKWTVQTFHGLSTESEFASFNASYYGDMLYMGGTCLGAILVIPITFLFRK